MPNIPAYNDQQVGVVTPAEAKLTAAGGDAAAFGAAEGTALVGLGNAFQSAGNAFGAEAQALQTQENEAVANEATTNYLIKQSEITERFKQLQGRDPAAAMSQYTKDLQALRSEMRAGLSNPEVQRLFDRETTRQFGYSVMNASSYAAQQQKAYVNAQQRAMVDTSVRTASDADDERVFRASLGDIADKVRGSADAKGQAPEVIDAEIRAQQGKAWGVWLKNVAESDPTKARQILNRERKGIDGIVAQNLDNYINTQTVSKISGRLVNDAVLGGATDTKQQKLDYAMSFLTSKLGKAAAAGLVGGMDYGESGMNTKALNPGDGSDGTNSIGIAQWNSSRAENLKRFAKERGVDWHDFKTQVAFVAHELETTHKGVGDKLRATNDVVAAARIATGEFEVAGGTRGGDPSGVPSLGGRVAAAQRLASQVVSPITVLSQTPGQRQALENQIRKTAEEYATTQGLDQSTKDELVRQSVAKLDAAVSRKGVVDRDLRLANQYTLTDYVNGGQDGKDPIMDLEKVTGPGAPPEVREAWYQTTPQQKQAIIDRVKRNASAGLTPSAPTPETLANRKRLSQLAVDDPDAFLKQVETIEQVPLTRSDLSWALREGQRIAQGRVNSDEAATRKGAVDSAVSVMRSNGLLDVTGLRKEDVEKDPSKMAQLRGALVQELDAFNLANEGRRPNEKELLEIGRKIVREEISAPVSVFGFQVPLTGGSKSNKFDPTTAARPTVNYDDIPAEAVQRLGEKFRENGIPATRQNYRIYYQRLLERRANAGAQ